MNESFNYIIRFGELGYEKQQEIIQGIILDLQENRVVQDYLLEIVGSDPFDLGRVNADDVMEYLENTIYEACDRSWAEWNISIKL